MSSRTGGKRHREPTDEDTGPTLRKRSHKSFHEPSTQESDDEPGQSQNAWWAVAEILDERGLGRAIEYLCQWEPHPSTGETYDPSWEPAAHLTEDLREHWNARKARQPVGETASQAPYTPDQDSIQTDSQDAASRQLLARPAVSAHSPGGTDDSPVSPRSPADPLDRRSSSSAPPSPRSSAAQKKDSLAAPCLLHQQQHPDTSASLASSSPVPPPPSSHQPVLAPDPDRKLHGVFIAPTSSFDRDDYLFGFSQLSQPSPEPPRPGTAGRNEESLHVPAGSAGFWKKAEPQPTRIEVPDSQDVDDSDSHSSPPSPAPSRPSTAAACTTEQQAHEPGRQKSPAVVLESDPILPSSQPSLAGLPPSLGDLLSQTVSGIAGAASATKPSQQSLAPVFGANKPSPLRNSHTASSGEAKGRPDQNIIRDWGSSGDPRELDSQIISTDLTAQLGDQPQSTYPNDLEPEEAPSSSILRPPSRDPETLASHLPAPLDVSSMAGTRRSGRSSAAPTAPSSSQADVVTAATADATQEGHVSQESNETTPKAVQAGLVKDGDVLDEDADLDDKTGTGLNSSAGSIVEGEIQSQTKYADANETEPVMDHDEQGNSRLAARIPGESNDEPTVSKRKSPSAVGEAAILSNESTSTSEGGSVVGPNLGQMEFIVPLPFSGQARDQYRKVIKYNEDVIEKFTSRKWADSPQTMLDAQALVQSMYAITTHVDLTNETTESQAEMDPTDVIEWDRSVSTKFKVLYELISAIKDQALHLAVVVQPGRALDILENFAKGMEVRYARVGATRDSAETQAETPLLVTIMSSDADFGGSSVAAADMVLSFVHLPDDFKIKLQSVREAPDRAMDHLTPLVSLAVVNSIDHVDHSIATHFTGSHRLRLLVNCLAKLRKDAGKVDPQAPTVEESAAELARFLTEGPSEDGWRLEPIGSLSNNDAWDLSQGLVSMKCGASSDSEKAAAKAKAAAKQSQKRPLDSTQDEDSEAVKKMKMTTQAEQPEEDASTTRISDSTVNHSTDSEELAELKRERGSIAELLKATEEKLLITKEASDARVYELEQDLNDLQFRFEEQTAERRTLQKELTETRILLESSRRQREARDATVEKLKDDVRGLKTQLNEAHAALSGSLIPEVAQLEKLRQEKADAEAAQRRAEKSAASQESMVGYVRQQWEEARTRAMELQEENEDLAKKAATFERQANGEISKARAMFLDEVTKALRSQNIRLRQENRNLQLLITRKDEELKNRKVGMGTRAGSVPRSPRLGPASRAGSPISDRRIGALKSNAMGGGRRLSKAAKSEASDDSPRASTTSAPTGAETKPRSGRSVEAKKLESKEKDPKGGADGKPPGEQLPPAPRPTDARSSVNASRPFPCTFAQYNCGSAFTSKNEWKRHISTKHIQLGFWRCDMCPPSPGIDHPVYNDFNRKDLFTQHLRRMHAIAAPPSMAQELALALPAHSVPPGSPNAQNLTEEQITEIQKRCYRQLRNPPDVSSCVFCNRQFSGPNSWEERLEHVGGHLERDRKNGTACLDVSSWRPDPPLRDYLVTEGLVEIDPRGGYRIGDGKPKRPMDVEGFAGQAPTVQLTPRAGTSQDSMATPSAGSKSGQSMDMDSVESSAGKLRRRGRPPKRQEAMEIDIPPTHPHPQPLQPQMSMTPNSPAQGQQFGPATAQPTTPQGPPPHTQQLVPPPGYPLHHGPSPSLPVQQGPPPQQVVPLGYPQHPTQSQIPPPMQSPRDGGMSVFSQHPRGASGPPPSPRQFHGPPSNLHSMYEFRHGAFTKFAGTQQAPWQNAAQALQQRSDNLPPGPISRGGPGQPNLAPKPAPDPVQEIMSRIYAQAPQLAPKPLTQADGSRDGNALLSRPPSQHGQLQALLGPAGFRPINDARGTPVGQKSSAGTLQLQQQIQAQQAQNLQAQQQTPQQVVGSQDGARQLAPKPAQPHAASRTASFGSLGASSPSQQSQPQQQEPNTAPHTPSAPPPNMLPLASPGPQSVPPSATAAPSTPQGLAIQPLSTTTTTTAATSAETPALIETPTTPADNDATAAGAERDEGPNSSRGKSFREIVMS